jgi:hypothetical protein
VTPGIDTLIAAGLTACNDAGHDNARRGAALEQLAQDLFGAIPGVTLTLRNNKDAFYAQEIDVAAWNQGDPAGLLGFPQILLIECKNWSAPVGSMEIAWFDTKLRLKGCSFGVLLALEGITGKPHSLTAAYSILAAALREKRDIVVITKGDLEALQSVDDLVALIKQKMLQNRVAKPF